MAEAKDHVGAMNAAGASLRDTAKWLAGGIFATAAAVFAGSSLTSLGSLDFDTSRARLIAAIAGALIGFGALGWLFRHVVGVLTCNRLTLQILADSEAANDDSELARVACAISKDYRDRLPAMEPRLPKLIEEFKTVAADSPDQKDIADMVDILTADAGFRGLRAKFDTLTGAMPWCGALAILGFGLFAWAANPPDKPALEAHGLTIKFVP